MTARKGVQHAGAGELGIRGAGIPRRRRASSAEGMPSLSPTSHDVEVRPRRVPSWADLGEGGADDRDRKAEPAGEVGGARSRGVPGGALDDDDEWPALRKALGET